MKIGSNAQQNRFSEIFTCPENNAKLADNSLYINGLTTHIRLGL